MTKISAVIFLAMCIVFMGCPIRSLSPLFTEKEITFNPDLVGSWKNVKEGDITTFRKSGEKEYMALALDKNGDTAKYSIQLGKVGNFWFMDSYSANKTEDYQMLPTHMIWRVWIEGDTLRLASLEGDWLKQMIESKKVHIQHARSNDDIVLTASSGDLQKLVLRYAGDEKAFPHPDVCVRVK